MKKSTIVQLKNPSDDKEAALLFQVVGNRHGRLVIRPLMVRLEDFEILNGLQGFEVAASDLEALEFSR